MSVCSGRSSVRILAKLTAQLYRDTVQLMCSGCRQRTPANRGSSPAIAIAHILIYITWHRSAGQLRYSYHQYTSHELEEFSRRSCLRRVRLCYGFVGWQIPRLFVRSHLDIILIFGIDRDFIRTAADFDKWSWSNQVGSYQTYIYVSNRFWP